MTDENALRLVVASLAEIRETPAQYGEVHIIVSGGEVKFVNVTKPPTSGYKNSNSGFNA